MNVLIGRQEFSVVNCCRKDMQNNAAKQVFHDILCILAGLHDYSRWTDPVFKMRTFNSAKPIYLFVSIC